MSKIVKEVKSYNKYPNELKRKIAIDYLSGGYSHQILAEKNGLKNKGVVKEFVKWYKKQLLNLETSIDIMPEEDEKTKEETPEGKQLRELEEQLRLAQLKVEGLETMIDIAEEQFKIEIRKKSGAKPSKK